MNENGQEIICAVNKSIELTQQSINEMLKLSNKFTDTTEKFERITIESIKTTRKAILIVPIAMILIWTIYWGMYFFSGYDYPSQSQEINQQTTQGTQTVKQTIKGSEK